MIVARSRASLIQYLEYQQQERLEIIFNKYGIETPEFVAGWERPAPSHIGRIKRWLEPATPEAIDHLLTEIVADGAYPLLQPHVERASLQRAIPRLDGVSRS